MFRWYANAHICYSYLLDVTFEANDQWERDFIASSWFTRSWTLQELLAPKSMKFYDCRWNKIGLRSALSEEIAEASGIHLSALTSDKIDLTRWSIAQRMSWASTRTATRVEDIAYSLLGIFDVNMPLLYGEVQKAFRRLQEEIIRQTYDHTVFAWSSCGDECLPGLLTSSPAAFKHDSDVVQRDFQDAKAYNLTDLGPVIELPLEVWVPSIYWAGLNCTKNAFDQLGIWLLRSERQKYCYTRVSLRLMESSDGISLEQTGRHLPQKQTPSWRYLFPRRAQLPRCRQMTINIATTESGSRLRHYLLRNPPPPVAQFLLSTMQVPHEHTSSAVERGSFSHPVNYSPGARSSTQVLYSTHRNLSTVLCGPRQEVGAINVETKDISPHHPSIGLICIVTTPNSGVALSALRLGFDRDFRPVCIIGETSHPAVRSPPSSLSALSALFDHPDRTDSDNLSGKTFWQCNGLEELGWQSPGLQVLLHQKHTQCGLWALRADRSGTSNFTLRTNSAGRSYLVSICFQKLGTVENAYSFSLIQRRGSS